jgi:iron complex transport system substrate-binding protein
MKHRFGFPAALMAALLSAYALSSPKMFARQENPRSFSDAKEHKVTLSAKPMRIASVVLGVDENLLDLVDPARIVTMTEISKDAFVSNVAGRVPPRTTLVKDQWQKVIDSKPDLVLAATYTPTLADPLIARKLPVYQFTEFRSIDDLLKNFEILGELVGEEKKAQEILAADRTVLANAAKRKPSTPMRAVYFSEGNVFARGTVPSEVLTLAGLTDAAADSGHTRIVKATPALIEGLRPDVIFYGEDSKTAEDETRAMFRKPEYQKIAAVKAGRVYAIPGKHITTTSHNIVKAVEDVQALVGSSR